MGARGETVGEALAARARERRAGNVKCIFGGRWEVFVVVWGEECVVR